jgi:hypothetical protein
MSAEHVECVPVSIDVSIGMLACGFRPRSIASTHRDTFALLARGVKIAIAVRAIRLNSVPHLPSRLSALHFVSASHLVAYEVQSRCGCLCRRRQLPVGMTGPTASVGSRASARHVLGRRKAFVFSCGTGKVDSAGDLRGRGPCIDRPYSSCPH